MNDPTLREQMEQFHQEVSALGTASKDSQLANQQMQEFYSHLTPDHQAEADQIVTLWLHSEDSDQRFTARNLIKTFHIVSALPTLREVAKVYETRNDPGGPYEWAAVNRLIGVLVAGKDSGTS